MISSISVKWNTFSNRSIWLTDGMAESAGAVEYTDSISAEE